MLARFLRWVTDLDNTQDMAGLDDRMLADVGVVRNDIGRLVWGASNEAVAEPQASDGGSGRRQRTRWLGGPRRTFDACGALPAVLAVARRKEPAR